MNTFCTGQDAAALVTKLHDAIDGYPYTDSEKREFMLMCRSFAAEDISAAIGRVRNDWQEKWLPKAATIAQAARAVRAERLRDQGTPKADELIERRLAWVSDHPGEPVPSLAETADYEPAESPSVVVEEVPDRLAEIRAANGIRSGVGS